MTYQQIKISSNFFENLLFSNQKTKSFFFNTRWFPFGIHFVFVTFKIKLEFWNSFIYYEQKVYEHKSKKLKKRSNLWKRYWILFLRSDFFFLVFSFLFWSIAIKFATRNGRKSFIFVCLKMSKWNVYLRT